LSWRVLGPFPSRKENHAKTMRRKENSLLGYVVGAEEKGRKENI